MSFGLFSPSFQFVCWIVLWRWCVVVAARRLFLVSGSRASSSSLCVGFLWRWLIFWAPQHMGSCRSRAGTHLPCAGRRAPNHWTPREAYQFLHRVRGEGPCRLEKTSCDSPDRMCSFWRYGQGAECGSWFASLCMDSHPCSLALLTTCQCGLCPQVNSLGPFTLSLASLGVKCDCHSLALPVQPFLGAAQSP